MAHPTIRSLMHAALPKVACAAITASIAFAATSVQAGAGDWHQHNSVAAAGIVDEADMDEVKFRGPKATVSGDSGKVTLRYDINLFQGPGNLANIACQEVHLFMRCRDNGDNARVVAKLKQLELGTGNVTTLLVLDSNDAAQSTSFNRISTSDSGVSVLTLLHATAYYVEVTITKNASDGIAEVAGVQVYVRENS